VVVRCSSVAVFHVSELLCPSELQKGEPVFKVQCFLEELPEAWVPALKPHYYFIQYFVNIEILKFVLIFPGG
jgi:hypothetical protein